ncbi:MAG: phosphatase PAP2 family protein [Actinobacteria bacterium]|nr:phosphatase PAP2 family protein [Actinomycetota bacterium]MBV8395673.1 phosphatase PAP2 family protein [Actinomycetota bacterium]MBV8598799.1 phosphatase PAP2 family protein [Actinomycetota bacterium]
MDESGPARCISSCLRNARLDRVRFAIEHEAVDNEHTLGPVPSHGAAEAIAVLPRPALGVPSLPRVRLRGRIGRVPLAILTLFASASVVTWSDGLSWTPDRMLLIFLAPALVLRRGRRYLRDFVPFAVLIFLYAECRGLAHVISPHPYYRPQLWLERHLFGIVPAQWLQEHFRHGARKWYDEAAAGLLQLHYIVPPFFAFLLWMKRRALFFRFASSLALLSFASSVIFAVFPAAPPWAAAQAGLLQHVVKLPDLSADVSSAGLSHHSFSLAGVVVGNPYAAIPSLHAAYAFLVFLVAASLLVRWRHPLRWPVIALCSLYPLLEGLAVVYTGNHYVVDIVFGFAFAAASLAVTNRLWRRFSLPA